MNVRLVFKIVILPIWGPLLIQIWLIKKAWGAIATLFFISLIK